MPRTTKPAPVPHVGRERRRESRGAGRTVVVGLGNPILSDDVAGILAAREVRRRLDGVSDVEVYEASLGGFNLLDLLAGFDRAILIDAIKSPGARPGSVHRLESDGLAPSVRIAAMHEINLPTALALGRMLGTKLPAEVVVYAIEVEEDRRFGESVHPEVETAACRVAARVVSEVQSRRAAAEDGIQGGQVGSWTPPVL